MTLELDPEIGGSLSHSCPLEYILPTVPTVGAIFEDAASETNVLLRPPGLEPS